MNDISRSMNLTPRNEHFHFEAAERVDWFNGDAGRSIVFNALSVLFPEGEKFFMDSVKNFRDKVDDPTLQQQVKVFLTQEAMHTREHVQYNKQLDAQGYSATKLHKQLGNFLRFLRKVTTKRTQLAVTCGLEHFTGILADEALKHEEILGGADERYRRAWTWHALEETEHKGVAYDVMQKVCGVFAYPIRAFIMIPTTIIFAYFIWKHIIVMMHDRGLLFSGKTWSSVLDHMVGRVGLFRRMIPAWFDYFRPGFHPWDHDNRQLLDKTEKEVQQWTDLAPMTTASAAA